MATQATASERRQHPREGILGQLENITYSVLRKYGITGESTREAVMSGVPQESAVRNDVHQEPLEPARLSVASAIPRISASQESKNKSRLRKGGTTMSANLVIVLSNPKPNRERRCAGTWLVHSRGQDSLQVHVAHDSSDSPHVLYKGAV